MATPEDILQACDNFTRAFLRVKRAEETHQKAVLDATRLGDAVGRADAERGQARAALAQAQAQLDSVVNDRGPP